MAKKRRRRNKQRRRDEQSTAAFAYHAREAYLKDNLVYERNKAAQSEYLERIARIEKDILSRTVYVFQARDLKRDANLEALRLFLETRYGLVEECIRHHDGKKKHPFPGARVRFQFKLDAEKIFGGSTELSRISTFVEVPCAVGCRRGMIRIKPCPPYADIAKMELIGSTIEFTATRLALGHWFPPGKDVFTSWTQEGKDLAEWLGEVETDISCTFSIDLNKRTVELGTTGVSEVGAAGVSGLGGLMSLLGVFEPTSRHFASFRFKELVDHIDIGIDPQNPDEYTLLFELKHPPKLESESVPDRVLGHRERTVQFGTVPSDAFGECLSFKLSVSSTALDRIFLNRGGWDKLQSFGVFQRGVRSVQDAIPFASKFIGDLQEAKASVNHGLEGVEDQRVGLLFRSVLDHGTFCWFHAFGDKVAGQEGGALTILDLLRACPSAAAVQTLHTLLATQGKTKFPGQLFQKLAPRDPDSLPERHIPAHCFSVPRIHITPLKQRIVGFEVEMSNRVIRRFVEEESFCRESFLRLQVCDEDGRKLFHNDLSNSVVSKLKSTILSGVVLNGRRYMFLAFSSSQLKECSVWMVCPEGAWTIMRMRHSLGDFSMCKTPSKYAARVGQCFSTTVQGLSTEGGSLPLSSAETKFRVGTIDDIVSEYGCKVLCHSDGNGLIRREVMNHVVMQLPFGPSLADDVSIIQIRFGGAKGTLTAWDFGELGHSSSLAQFDVCLRPSMIKFKDVYKHLEVCSVGVHVPYYLNRNVIFLLGRHGVCDETFLQMQRTMLDELDGMLVDRDKALDVLPQLGGPDNTLKSILIRMMVSGISPAEDPFLYSCLHAIRSHHIYGLRKKARIFVQDGAVLMGGIDETGLVPEGCVFVQVRRSRFGASSKSSFEPIVGKVMVTKHPVMHPGDVRMLLAVDIPALRAHRNVILFSRKGSRPEADKMAGSDLDGDEFAVTWDPRLFLNANRAAFDYDGQSSGDNAATGLPSSDKERSEALLTHFFNHAQSDNLGQIAMLWQDYAAKNGADCGECVKLAELHSIAVDFPKSGIPAKLPRELCIPRSQPRAHWRERKGVSFHCTTVIGKLYDEATGRVDTELMKKAEKAVAGRKKDQYGQLVSTAEGAWVGDYCERIYDASIPMRLGFTVEGEALIFANEQRHSYDRQVVTMMNRYRINSEGELFTGCIRKYHKYHKKRQHEFSEAVRRECREVRHSFRVAFFREVLRIVASTPEEQTGTFEAALAVDNTNAVAGTGDTTLYPSGFHYDSDDEAASDLNESDSEGDDGVEEGGDPEEDEAALLVWVEELATSPLVPAGPSREWMLRRTAHQLAASYYMATYSPQLRWRQQGKGTSKLALFSFPWMVVADVIAAGLQETTEAGQEH